MDETIIDKIKKLLRMKRGGTPAEIETALAMAQKLAAKHGIDINSVDPEEKLKSEMGHTDGWIGSRAPYDVRYAAKIVERFFNVDVIYRPGYRHVHSNPDGDNMGLQRGPLCAPGLRGAEI
jgi:hypothetical protein